MPRRGGRFVLKTQASESAGERGERGRGRAPPATRELREPFIGGQLKDKVGDKENEHNVVSVLTSRDRCDAFINIKIKSN